MVICLKVKTLDSQTYDFSVDDEISVRQFKETIAEKTNISADLQRIIYCGRVLSDEKLLKEYDVNGKVVHVVERPPPSSRISTNSSENTTTRRTRFDGLEGNVRGPPLFRALDGMVVGAMTIPVNAPGVTQTTVPPLNPSSSFCMNRITVARHMLECANNIASYLENPERGLNNSSLDILAQGRWTMESTVVEVGISAADNVELPQNHTQNIVEALHGAVSAALRQNGHPNVTVVQLPTVFGSNGTAVVSSQSVNSTNSSDDVGASGGGSDGGEQQSVSIETTTTASTEGRSEQSERSTDETMNETSSTETDVEPENATGGSETTATDNNTSQSQEQRRPNATSASASASVGNSNSSSPTRQRTATRVLADVINQMTTVQNRLAPFVNRYYEILQNDPVFEENDTAGRESAQRIFDRVSEALHYMSHAQHAISDLMLDLSQPTPRYLCCRPILVEQSGFVSANNIASLFQPNGNNGNGSSGNNGSATAATINIPSGDLAASLPIFVRPSSAPPPQQQQQQQQQQQSQPQPQPQTQPILITNPPTIATNQVSSGNGSSGGGGGGGGVGIQQNQNQQNINRSLHRIFSPLLLPMSPRLSSGNNNAMNSSSSSTVANSTNNTTTGTANDNGNQLNDPNAVDNPEGQTIAEIVLNLPPRRILISNPQLQVARFIQAVVNSAPLDADLHVQINAPNLLTFGLPIIPQHLQHQHHQQQQQQQQSVTVVPTAPVSQQQQQQQSTTQQSQQQQQQQQPTNVLNSGANNDMNNTTAANETNQARVTTATHPTTSTQTRSTPRPQVHIANIPPSQMWNTRVIPANMVSSFDRFLPCSSHHIRENEVSNENLQNASNIYPRSRTQIHQRRQQQQQQQQQEQQLRQQQQSQQQQQQIPQETSTASSTTTQQISSSNRSNNSTSNDFYQSLSAVTEIPINLFGSNIMLRELINFTPSPNTFNRIRSNLLEFIINNLFAGAPITEENMNNAINNVIQLLNDALLFLPQFDLSDYDSRASVENLIRNSLPLIINLIREDDSNEFGTRLLRELMNFVRRLFVIIVTCIGRSNAELYLNQIAQMALNSNQVPEQELLRTLQTHFMQAIIRELDITLQNTNDVQEFLVIRRPSPEQQQQQQQQNQTEPMETDEHMASDSDDNQQINERAIDVPSENNSINEGQQQQQKQHQQQQSINAASKSTMTAEIPVQTSTPTPIIPTNEPLPKIVFGSEPWHNHFPSNWLPIITRDIEKQRRQSPQAPFSDAYISGMSAKRRKLIANSKPPTDIQSLITDDVRRAIQAVNASSSSTSSSSSGGGSGSSSTSKSATQQTTASGTITTPLSSEYTIEEVSTAIGTDPAVQLSYREALRTSIQERLRQDPDFIPEKYPNSSKYFMK